MLKSWLPGVGEDTIGETVFAGAYIGKIFSKSFEEPLDKKS
jgi:hypothetical protein